MSITVRLIFWGLVGFVPNTDLDKGMTAVLTEPGAIHEGECHVQSHAARVWLLEGKCTGDCLRQPPEEKDRATKAGLPSPLEQMASAYQLRWWLDREHLEVTGGALGVTLERGSRPRVDGNPVAFPVDLTQTEDFSWVPDLDVLTSNGGAIDSDCLGKAETCSMRARFKIKSGRATACHLLHRSLPDGTDLLGVFGFQLPNGNDVADYVQAVADAVLVETTVPESSVELQSWDLSNADPRSRGTAKATATLSPKDGSNVITLLIGHWESPNGPQPSVACRRRMLRRHSEIFFDLLDDLRQERSIRHFISETRLMTSPGSCEADLEGFQNVLKAAVSQLAKSHPNLRKKMPPVWPHTSRECDTRKFQANPNG